MADINNMIEKIEKELRKIDLKIFNVFFFVYDTKGTPSGSLTNIYETAYQLQEMGYRVKMLYSEKEFIGVEGWLGEKYANLPHSNVDKEILDVSPADVLFIPEMYSNIMTKTKGLPCKRIALLNNMDYLTSIIPYSATWEQFGIRECIVNSNALKSRIEKYFPSLKTYIVNPAIGDFFENKTNDKKPIINIIAKDENDVNRFIKPFYWLYPFFRWIPFRNLVGLPKDEFAKALDESFLTVWLDKDSNFGYSALESMACGSMVAGLIPDKEPDWMFDNEGKLVNNGIWVYKIEELEEIVASFISNYMHNVKNSELIEGMDKTCECYTMDKFRKSIESTYVEEIFANRKKELQIALDALKNNIEKKKTDEK